MYIQCDMIFMLGGLRQVVHFSLKGVSMIIDSHVHYNSSAFKNTFRYLTRNEDGYDLAEGERKQLIQELLDANIPYSIEPGASLQSCEEVLKLT